ncbi:hypothetical protein BCR44DRAFT_1424192 [Catenaria anguillulae PL171]|uniref:Uncharacterized protein n=1 Tax=Catenaria anguillulae PL171 TaxID=765915 RepID=A0A1Y2I2B3_9FUNG|nr:hypothetical protein BCR44DRAFT_1424192 [Catenaria anguillulae PL171]
MQSIHSSQWLALPLRPDSKACIGLSSRGRKVAGQEAATLARGPFPQLREQCQ